MRLTIQLKLNPTSEQAALLKRTLETANAACDTISQIAWDARSFKQFAIHKLAYYDVKESFGLTSQLVVRCIGKVADVYKLDKKAKRTFAPLGAVPFDDRILSFKSDTISIWTVGGRQTLPFVCGKRQRELLAKRRGETDLVFVRGNWFLFATCEIEAPEPIDVDGFLGVDLGLVNLATDSDGEQHSGALVKIVRQKRFDHRNRLQQANTRRACWRLRKLAGKEARFQKDVNHGIFKRLVVKACASRKALALEKLTHIRKRTDTTVRRNQRRTRSSWAFAQLRQFVTYKAQLAGIPVVLVAPAYTSQTCSVCGHCERANRKNQADFVCRRCGYGSNADVNAAVNIAFVAACQTANCVGSLPDTSRRVYRVRF